MNNKYYMWCHSFSHAIINCVMFMNAIQKALKEERFKLVDCGLINVIVDINLFLNMATNMISVLAYNFHPKTEKEK